MQIAPDPARAPVRKILVVEDEILISMLLEDMLNELGYDIAGTATRIEEAIALAREGAIDAAILDVNLSGQEVYPVADILAKRGIPFLFATGYGDIGLPAAHQQRPTLAKPFQQEMLERQLAALFVN